ncbi:MAG TPA: hypothetical protein VIW73_08900, partial [Candidatus Cybelea sp.]
MPLNDETLLVRKLSRLEDAPWVVVATGRQFVLHVDHDTKAIVYQIQALLREHLPRLQLTIHESAVDDVPGVRLEQHDREYVGEGVLQAVVAWPGGFTPEQFGTMMYLD